VIGVDDLIQSRADILVERLGTLVRQPTVSSTGEGMAAGAQTVAAMARACGLDAIVIESPGHPYVLASTHSRASGRTLLITTHYDVQPAEPLDAWESPPFEVTASGDGKLLGRGTTDAKGPIAAVLAALEALLQTHGAPPCNVQVLFDGEEEIGSPSMPWLVERHGAEIRADGVVTFDGNCDPGGRAAIMMGSGGLLYLELRVRTGERDLHANRGALAPNAVWRLVWALASLKAPDERILIDGFEDALVPIRAEERAMMAAIPWDDRTELEALGLPRFLEGRGGENGPLAYHILPILGVSSFQGGYAEGGVTTVLPVRAAAKLYIGLREAQQPEEILAGLRAHLDRRGFDDVEVEVLAATEPASCALDSAASRAACRAAERVTGLPAAVYPRWTAYGRQGCWIARRIGTEAAQVAAVGPHGARNHSANEFITRDYLVRGSRLVAATIQEFARE
jgi:acetylornithine deacetylase/succinyl-diaminopimelate desuccinylase-like protein